jgi:hypothetical protein
MSVNQESTSTKPNVPVFNRRDIARWRILLRALLKRYHQADRVLDRAKPEFDGDAYRAILGQRGETTAASKEFEKKFRSTYRKWSNRNEIALSFITESCKDDPIAFTVIQEFPEATAKELYDKLNERFSNARLVNLRQVELTAFNSMTVGDGETAEEFANRILQAKLRLKEFGEVIEDDVHCLMRLKEGLRGSSKYGQLATSLYTSVDQTWSSAYQIVQVWDAQEIAKPITSSDLSKPLPMEKANRAEVFRQRDGGRDRVIKCTICRKKGHSWRQCRKRKNRSSNGSYQMECHRCGKKGHKAANCYAKLDPKQLQDRKRQREQSEPREQTGGRDHKKSKWFDEGNDDQNDYVAMMRVVTEHSKTGIENSTEQQKLKPPEDLSLSAVLDSGCSSHMFCKRTAEDYVRGGEERFLAKRPKIVKTAKRGESIVVREERDIGVLKNVLISEDFDENLVSIPKLDSSGHKTIFCDGRAIVYDKNGDIVLTARLENGLYRFDLDQIHRANLGSVAPVESLTLWHQRLGHRNRRQLAHAIKTDLIRGPSKELSRNLRAPLCDSCVRAKSTVRPVSSALIHSPSRSPDVSGVESLSEQREKWMLPAESILPVVKTVQVDLKGPINVPTIDGQVYFISLIEEESRY